MKKFKIVLLFSLILAFNNNLLGQTLSDNAEVSILICAPGNDLYSTFGHSAIRIKDSALRIDNVYNYGTFNFETPNFYLKFVRGQLDYMLSVSRYKYFVISYMNENRWIKEHVLDLTYKQKNEVYKFLYNNALPQNKYYKYDFFYDNCATRVKDVIKDVLKDELILPKKITEDGITFRDLTHIYLQGHDWERFGTNLALGRPTDKVVNVEEATFLPDYLDIAFQKSVLKINGKEKPLIKQTRMLFEPKTKQKKANLFFTPIIVFSLLLVFILILTYFEIKNKRNFIILDKTIFFISGLIGIVLLALWFGTEHTAVVNNLNIIWAMPLSFFAAFMLKHKNKNYIKKFFLVMTIILLISLLLKIFSFWVYDYTIIPLVMILILRSFLISKRK